MIFVTVGAQMPFDRLVKAVDDWARLRERADVFAQIGPTEWRPEYIEWTRFLPPADFASKVQDATAVVAHAGMGSILTALKHAKPILVMPRRGDLRETRNDHQLATARRLAGMGGVAVAFDEEQLADRLDRVDQLEASHRIGDFASEELLRTVRSFIAGDAAP